MKVTKKEPTTNPQIHIQSNETENPNDANEIVFHKMSDGTLFVEYYLSSELEKAGLGLRFQSNYNKEQLIRLKEFFNNPKTY